jgi:hypothetical protein
MTRGLLRDQANAGRIARFCRNAAGAFRSTRIAGRVAVAALENPSRVVVAAARRFPRRVERLAEKLSAASKLPLIAR